MPAIILFLLFKTLLINETFASNVKLDNLEDKVSIYEEREAKKILEINSKISNFEIDYNLLIDLKKNSRQDSIFQNYIEEISKLILIKDKNQVESITPTCDSLNPNITTDFDYIVKKNLRNYCEYLKLKVISKKSKFKDADTIEIKNSIYKLVDSCSPKILTKLVNNLINIKPFQPHLNNALVTSYIELNKEIPQEILKKLEITTDLTSHIQHSGYDKGSTKKVLYSELKKIYNNLISNIKDRKTPREKLVEDINNFNTFVEINLKQINSEETFRLLMSTARSIIPLEMFKESETILELSKKLVVNEEQSEEVDFVLIWLYYNSKNVDKIKQYISKNDLLDNPKKFSNRIKFWLGYALEKNDEKKMGLELYEKILEVVSFDFYTIIAMKRATDLNKKKSYKQQFVKQLQESEFVFKIPYDNFGQQVLNSLRRISVWVYLGKQDFYDQELKHFLQLKEKEILKDDSNFRTLSSVSIREHATHLLTQTLNKNKNYLKTFNLVFSNLSSDLLTPNKTLLEILFPTLYLEKIKQIDPNSDPLVYLSLIRQESAFNPFARSPVGARGLMQLMPATAKQISRKLKTKELNDPDINLKIGITYFKKLINKYDGNLVFALSAYNAGERNVQKWLDFYFTSESLLHNIESIPFSETRLYVKLILRNIFFYKIIHLSSNDENDLNKVFDHYFDVE